MATLRGQGRELVPTAKAFQLMTLLRGLDVEDLTKPELTGNWEYQLAEMEHGRLSRTQFMREIVKMTKHIVAQAKNYESDTIPGDFATLAAPCPKGGGEVHEKYKKFQCVNPSCDFGFWKILGGRQLEPAEADADPGRPQVRVGYARLEVETAQKRLSVAVRPDGTERRPRDKVRVDLE